MRGETRQLEPPTLDADEEADTGRYGRPDPVLETRLLEHLEAARQAGRSWAEAVTIDAPPAARDARAARRDRMEEAAGRVATALLESLSDARCVPLSGAVRSALNHVPLGFDEATLSRVGRELGGPVTGEGAACPAGHVGMHYLLQQMLYAASQLDNDATIENAWVDEGLADGDAGMLQVALLSAAGRGSLLLIERLGEVETFLENDDDLSGLPGALQREVVAQRRAWCGDAPR